MADNEIERFKLDVAKFSGHYEDFLVIVKTPEKRLLWKSSDKIWSLGAALRYANCVEEWDREDERQQMADAGDDE